MQKGTTRMQARTCLANHTSVLFHAPGMWQPCAHSSSLWTLCYVSVLPVLPGQSKECSTFPGARTQISCLTAQSVEQDGCKHSCSRQAGRHSYNQQTPEAVLFCTGKQYIPNVNDGHFPNGKSCICVSTIAFKLCFYNSRTTISKPTISFSAYLPARAQIC